MQLPVKSPRAPFSALSGALSGAMSGAMSGTIAILALTLFAACQRSANTPAGPPNVLLISLDALRADHLTSYGYGRDTSPFLDAVAAEGVRFEHAFVNTHGTPPSHTTMLSSLYQQTHRVQFNDVPDMGHYRIPDEVPLVQEHFRDAGYTTVGITAGGWMKGELGYSRGFDVFADAAVGIADGARALVDAVRAAPDDTPVFAFLHTYEIHSPYSPPADYRSLWGEFPSDFEATSENLLAINAGKLPIDEAGVRFVEAMYDAGIRYTDDTLREMFAALDAIGFFDHHLVVITSDHGEELGERGAFTHRDLLYDDLIRVPLIVRGSGVPVGRVDANLASGIDIAPTLLAFAGIDVDAVHEGRNLLSDADGAPDAVFSQYAGRRYSVRGDDWKLIVGITPPATELYDLRADPAERRNVAAQHPDTVQALNRRLDDWLAERPTLAAIVPRDVELSEDDLERLRSLGYLQ